jgi:quinol monooxygenase YgiN
MLIVTVDFATLPADRPYALATLQEEGAIVRALWGNLGYTVHLDPENAGGLRLTHHWNDATSFAAYRATPGFKAVGNLLFPKMVGKPVTAVYEATQMAT